MFEMSKEVLTKVSFDRKLFVKELRKFTQWMKKEEITQLRAWAIATFGASYYSEIVEILG